MLRRHKVLMSHKSFFTICIYTKEATVRHSDGMHRHLRRLMKGVAVSKACRKEELPHSVFIETK